MRFVGELPEHPDVVTSVSLDHAKAAVRARFGGFRAGGRELHQPYRLLAFSLGFRV